MPLPNDTRVMRRNKREWKRAVAERNAQRGFAPDPDATPEKAQRLLLDAGIRPEDNIASCEILQMRYANVADVPALSLNRKP